MKKQKSQVELKFKAILKEADNWWERLEPEGKVQVYFRELKKNRIRD